MGKKFRSIIAFTLLMLVSVTTFAQDKLPVKPAAPSALYSPALYIMLALIIVLLIAILATGESIKAAVGYRQEKNKNSHNGGLKTLLVLIMSGAAFGASAQETVPPAAEKVVEKATDYWGLDPATFYAFCAIIGFELLVWWILRNIAMQLLYTGKPAAAAKAPVVKPSLMERLNASVSIEKEAEIMTDHEYDGIRELDNNLPPWWKYGFYVSIVFAGVYLVHYHVFSTGKLQIAEYEDEVRRADEALVEYRKKAADMVDENTVTLLTDAGALESGQTLFTNNCVACHGKLGEGGMGPNLTDDYWLHGGSIQEVFKSIKYGWTEKGMKSWEQDFSPRQMHQLASYVKSLRGTNPPNAKEKQGDLYAEGATAPADSIQTDTLKATVQKK